jgi:hypothetical protein
LETKSSMSKAAEPSFIARAFCALILDTFRSTVESRVASVGFFTDSVFRYTIRGNEQKTHLFGTAHRLLRPVQQVQQPLCLVGEVVLLQKDHNNKLLAHAKHHRLRTSCPLFKSTIFFPDVAFFSGILVWIVWETAWTAHAYVWIELNHFLGVSADAIRVW